MTEKQASCGGNGGQEPTKKKDRPISVGRIISFNHLEDSVFFIENSKKYHKKQFAVNFHATSPETI
jgi:hypothetical protein